MTRVAREGEFVAEWDRSSRTFLAGGGWLVKTREGHPLGPYPTQFDAEIVAALLIAQLAQAPNPQACRRIIYNFRHDDRFRTVHPDRGPDAGGIGGFPGATAGHFSTPRGG